MDTGGVALAKLIRRTTTLRDLTLCSCKLYTEGTHAILSALGAARSLESLAIPRSYILKG